MKRILFSLMWVWLSNVQAQEFVGTDSLTSSPYEQGEYILENLDKTEMETSFLLDKGLAMVDFGNHDGIIDTSYQLGSVLDFAMAYASISSMALDTHDIVHPLDCAVAWDAITDSTIVPIGIMHFEYDQFKSEALDSNLVYESGGQLYDTPGRTTSPYQQNELFLASPLAEKHGWTSFYFKIDSNFFYRNHTKSIDSLVLDVGDGNGAQQVTFNQLVFANYPTEGEKEITMTIYYADSSVMVSKSKLEVFNQFNLYADAFSPDLSWYVEAADEYLGEKGSADVSIFYGCGHEQLRKPLIWVEGFNPIPLIEVDPDQNLDPEYMLNILASFKGEIDGLRFTQQLDYAEYDLIYIDFHDGGDYIQRNARVVEQVIRQVNAVKNANGSSEENIVIGESMGGLVARYALLEMEANDEDHQTAKYISFDSPHQGANIPVSAQIAARQIPHMPIAGGVTQLWMYIWTFTGGDLDLRFGEQMLETPAAQQMLIYQTPDVFINLDDENLVNEVHTNFMAEYHAFGNLTECEELYSSNGSPLGEDGDQGFAPHHTMIEVDGGILPAFNFVFQGGELSWQSWTLWLSTHTEATLRAMPEYSDDKKLLYRFKVLTNLLVVPVIWSNQTVKVKRVYPIDSAPGGYYSLDIPDGVTVLNEAIDAGFVNVDFNTFNYIPTYSALNLSYDYLETPNVDLSDLAATNTESPAFRTTALNVPYSTSDIFGIPASFDNSLHIHLYPRKAQWLNFHLIGHDGINQITTLSSGSFNFGIGQFGASDHFENTSYRRTVSRLDGLNRITGTGQVYINKSNRIGFISVDDAPYTYLGTAISPTHFFVKLKPDCVEGGSKTLEVDNGGLLYIGEGPYQTGDLHLMPGTRLTIDDGGQLYIRENSKLIIHPGAKLDLKNGSHVVNYGEIELLGEPDELEGFDENGYILYEDGAEIIMPNHEAKINFNGGVLLVKDNATFTFVHAGYAESGQLHFSTWGKSIKFASGAKMYLTGKSESDVIVYLEENADFWTNNTTSFIKFYNGKVYLHNNSRLVSIPTFFADHINFEGIEGNRHLVAFQNTTISNCDFNNVGIDAPLYIKNNGILNIFSSSFVDYSGAEIIKVTGKGYRIQGSTFTADVDNIISSSGMTQTAYIHASTFNGNQTASFASSGVLDYSENELIIGGSDFIETDWAVEKSNGKLKLRCNNFTDFKNGGAYASNNCWLEMSTASNAGYNRFEKYSSTDGQNIALLNAAFMQIDDGSNIFDETGSLPIINGSLQVGAPGLGTSIPGHNNQWNLTSPTYMPLSGEFNLSSSIGGDWVTMSITTLEAAACGTYDSGIGTPIGYGGLSNIQETITTAGFQNENLVDAVNYTMKQTELLDSTGDDLYALQLFEEILTYSYQDTVAVNEREWLLDYTYQAMKHTMQHAISEGYIEIDSNLLSFDQYLSSYVTVLNTLSNVSLDSSNYHKLFRYELDKAHLYHTIGNQHMAITILENLEFCGLDSTEQVQVNQWKVLFEREKAIIDYGEHGYFLDTNWVDTSGYIQPTQQSFGQFASTILSPTTAQLSNCSSQMKPSFTTDEGSGLQVYPNPSNGEFTITYTIPENGHGLFIVYNLLGEEVFSTICQEESSGQTMDLTRFQKGVYLYRFEVNGIETNAGKLIKH